MCHLRLGVTRPSSAPHCHVIVLFGYILSLQNQALVFILLTLHLLWGLRTEWVPSQSTRVLGGL